MLLKLPLRSLAALVCGLTLTAGAGAAAGQEASSAPPAVLNVQTTLVLVPALVKTKAGEQVYTLAASDFMLTDDGVPQPLSLEADTDSEPLALVIVAQTGGSAAAHLSEYQGLGPLLDAMIGNVQHHVALVSFDSQPALVGPFDSNTDKASALLGQLDAGDGHAAIFDALAYAVDLLRKQPPAYRRAILMLSETVDDGSKTSLQDALQAVSDTNTIIYSLAFSSSRAALKHEASKFNSDTPGPVHGCMSHAADADPDAHGSRAIQAYDCASELLPPLRLARMAEIAARNSLRVNAPETVARLTGGEFTSFKDARSLRRGLFAFSNDVPNRYVLSFHPRAPQPGLHVLHLELVDRPGLELRARTAYWAAAPASGAP